MLANRACLGFVVGCWLVWERPLCIAFPMVHGLASRKKGPNAPFHYGKLYKFEFVWGQQDRVTWNNAFVLRNEWGSGATSGDR